MTAAAHLSYPAQGVALVLMDNPPMNFGSYALLEQVEAALDAAETAGSRVAILASDVPGYFMAHAWLPDVIAAYTGGPLSGDPHLWRRLTNRLERGSLISIAANNGQAWGGGGDLSWACNLRIAGRSATYGHIEAALGIFTAAGGGFRLPRLIGQSKAMELYLTCEPMGAEEAAALGLVNRVVDDDQLRAEVIAWAARIAGRPAWALRAAKRGILQTWDLHFEDAQRIENYIFNATMTPATLEIMRTVQARYDAGADSWEAFNLEV